MLPPLHRPHQSAGALTRLCVMALTVSASYSAPSFYCYRGGVGRSSATSIIPDPETISESWYERYVLQLRNRSMMGPVVFSPSVTPKRMEENTPDPIIALANITSCWSPEQPSDADTARAIIKKTFTRLREPSWPQ